MTTTSSLLPSLLRAFALAATTALATQHASAQIISPQTLAAEAAQSVAAGKDPVPGPRSCFWARRLGSSTLRSPPLT